MNEESQNRKKRTNLPNLKELLDIVKHDIFATLNCHRLGKVESVNLAQNTLSATISSKWTQDDGTVIEYPLLVDVPYMFLTGGQASITMPIEKGDDCLLLFNDRDIDNWFVGNTTAPNTPRLHSLSDGLAIVGFRNQTTKISDYPADCIRLKYGNTYIKIFTNKIELTDGSSSIIIDNNGVAISAPSQVNITAPTITITGNMSVNGAASITGAATLTGGANIAGIDFSTHVHGGVQGGPGTTQGPQ
jgi:hypothetical protein